MQAQTQSAESRAYIVGIMAGRPPLTDAPVFGQRLAALRKARGLSQDQLAKLMGKTRVTIDYYERRAKNPTAEVVNQAAEIFGVSASDLIGGGTPQARKPGPPSRLHQITQRLATLPRSKQRVVVDMLEGFLSKAGG